MAANARSPRVVVTTLAALMVVAAAACKSVPTVAVATPAPVLAARDSRLGSVARLEQQRVLQDAAPAAPGAAVASLPALAGDPDPSVRRRAVLAIGRVGSADGVAAVTAALKDPDEAVRAAAAFALGLLGTAARPSVSQLTPLLADPSMVVRQRAAEGLGLIGDAAAVPAVFQAADGCAARMAGVAPDAEGEQTPEIEICRVALFALVRLQSYDAVAAIAINAQGQPTSRWWPVAFALQRINDQRTVPALLALATTPGIDTAGFAIKGLGALKAPAVVPIAAKLAADAATDLKVRVAAVRALGQVGGAAGSTALLELLKSDALPQNLALEVLSATGAAGQPAAFDPLLEWITDPAPALRAAALAAAAKVAPEPFLTIYAGLGRDPDWTVRAALAGILATLPADRVTPAIRDLVTDEDARVHGPALRAMAAVKAPDLTARAFASLDAPDFVERATAASVVGDTKPEGGLARLIAAYARGESDVAYAARAAALEAIAKYANDEARAAVRRGLADRDWPVRLKAAELLHAMGEASAAPQGPASVRQPAEFFSSPAFLRPAFSPHAFIDTARGTVELELDVVNAPMTTQNFIYLARGGFFNGVAIHRVVPGFVVQAGDPRGDGEGGPGYAIPDELNAVPYVRGTVGMALDWRDTGGSQWFIALSPQPHLDAKYTAFARVVNGLNVVDQLSMWDVIQRVRIWDGVEFK